jgi:hypothetical protein
MGKGQALEHARRKSIHGRERGEGDRERERERERMTRKGVDYVYQAIYLWKREDDWGRELIKTRLGLVRKTRWRLVIYTNTSTFKVPWVRKHGIFWLYCDSKRTTRRHDGWVYKNSTSLSPFLLHRIYSVYHLVVSFTLGLVQVNSPSRFNPWYFVNPTSYSHAVNARKVLPGTPPKPKDASVSIIPSKIKSKRKKSVSHLYGGTHTHTHTHTPSRSHPQDH